MALSASLVDTAHDRRSPLLLARQWHGPSPSSDSMACCRAVTRASRTACQRPSRRSISVISAVCVVIIVSAAARTTGSAPSSAACPDMVMPPRWWGSSCPASGRWPGPRQTTRAELLSRLRRCHRVGDCLLKPTEFGGEIGRALLELVLGRPHNRLELVKLPSGLRDFDEISSRVTRAPDSREHCSMRFVIRKNAAGQFWWRAVGDNNKIMAASELMQDKQSCLDAIAVVQAEAATAKVSTSRLRKRNAAPCRSSPIASPLAPDSRQLQP